MDTVCKSVANTATVRNVGIVCAIMVPTNAHIYTKIVYTYNQLLHVSAGSVAIVRDVNHKGWVHKIMK